MKGIDLIAFRLMCVFAPLLLTICWWIGVHDPIGGGFCIVWLTPFLLLVWVGCSVCFVKARQQ